MCEYCEGISAPISFPQKLTYDNGETQQIQYGFRINFKERKLETFIKDCETGECDIVFSREIKYCPFCGILLDKIEKILENRKLYECATGKEVVINFCENVETHDIDYLENVLNNLHVLKKNQPVADLSGCPSSYGLEYYEGLCFQEDTKNMSLKEKEKMCNDCWRKALE